MKVSIEYRKATGGIRRGLDLCDQTASDLLQFFRGSLRKLMLP